MVLRQDVFDRLCRARALLGQQSERPVSIRAAARAAGMSHYHFIRRFEALFGLTPHQFRIRTRLDRAKQLLAAGRHSVTEVCLEVGMSSLGSFSDQFARRAGASPSVFQRRARAMVRTPGDLPPALFPGCLSLMASLPPDAFRNFQEAPAGGMPVQSEWIGKQGGIDADQADQHPGGRPGQGAAILYGDSGLSEET